MQRSFSFWLPLLLLSVPAGPAAAQSMDASIVVPALLPDGAGCRNGGINAVALQDAIDRAIAERKELFLPSGRFCIAASLRVQGVSGFRVTGRGSPLAESRLGTELVWDGGPSEPMWNLECRECYFADFTIKANRALSAGISSHNRSLGPGSDLLPTSLSFERVRMDGVDGRLGYGWLFTAAPGNDQHNDVNFFSECGVMNFTEAAVQFVNSQSKSNRFVHFAAVGGAGARAGISTGASGAGGGQGGNFQVFGASISNVQTVFDLGGPNDTFDIFSVYSEDSARLIDTSGGSRGGAVTLSGGRFAQNALHPDGKIIRFKWGGALIVRGMHFDAPLPAAAGGGSSAGHIWTAVFDKQVVIVEGNVFQTDAPELVVSQINPGASMRRTLRDNLRIDANSQTSFAANAFVEDGILQIEPGAGPRKAVVAESNVSSYGPATWAAGGTTCMQACAGMGMDQCLSAHDVSGALLGCGHPGTGVKFCTCF